ncbi:23S rRNA (adenine1618-N6)-methyltransferase [Luteibacter sp. HA06]
MKKSKSAAPPVTTLHPRNRHTGRYDFAELSREMPLLAAYVGDNGHCEDSIDFSDPHAVRALNRALLKSQYGIAHWDIPPDYLVPPIPGRADYVHGVADLLASSNGGQIPTGPGVRALDIGTGANLIYPLIGNREYGWRFTASEVDTHALRAAKGIVDGNPGLGDGIFLRRQENPIHVFEQLLRPEDRFDVSMCNPPFHSSAREAAAGNIRKTRNLDKTDKKAPPRTTNLNFGGQGRELWCQGGEERFIRTMITESTSYARTVLWFTTLVARSEHLNEIYRALTHVKAVDVRTVNMAQGNKQSRFVAWTFHDEAAQREWNLEREKKRAAGY